MKIKEIKRTANVAWSPSFRHPTYLAAATAAQQLDSSFSTSACLELFRLDFDDTTSEPKTCEFITTTDRLHKLVWSPGIKSPNDSNPDFLIGGAEQGRLFIWNPKNIFCKEEPLVYLLDKHVGAVSALDVNPFQVNLLASGAGNSEIFIWDLNNPDKPMTPGSKAQPVHDVVCVAWNKQVQHILGSSQDGNCIVWDLRKNEPIIQIRDSMSRMKCSLVCWHPDVATQLCIASEDDHTPAVQLWDLRSATSPVKQFEGHSRGILSLAWCPQDSGLLLSCGKDNRVLCWNPNSDHRTGEIVYELPNSNQWCFDVQWCPRNPGIISGCSFDGHISIYSITQGSHHMTDRVVDAFALDGTNRSSPALKSAPKWLKRPCGASFGFGGKLVTFTNSKVSGTSEQWKPLVTFSQVVTEPLLVMRALELEESLNNDSLMSFCDKKVSEVDGSGEGRSLQNDAEVWNFLKVSLEAGSHEKYLKLFNTDVTENEDLKKESNLMALDDKISHQGLFDTVEKDMQKLQLGHGVDMVPVISSFVPIRNKIWPNVFKTDAEELLTKALVRANFEEAVNVCINNQFLSEALMLAYAGGQKLFLSTQQAILKMKNSRLHKLISSIMDHNIESIVSSYEISKWRDILLIILTYSYPEELSSLCNSLGKRLEDASDPMLNVEAQLCYIVASNVEQLISNLEKNMDSSSHQKLQDVIEKVTVLQYSPKSMNKNAWHEHVLAERLSEYAEVLAEQGCAMVALRYLIPLNNLKSALLKDRVFNSLGREYTSRYQPPPKPFHVIDIRPQLAPQKPVQINSQYSQQFHQPGSLVVHHKPTTNQTNPTLLASSYAGNMNLTHQQSFLSNQPPPHYDTSLINPSTGQFYLPPCCPSEPLYNPMALNPPSSLGQNLPPVFGPTKSTSAWNDPPTISGKPSQVAMTSSGQSYQGKLYDPQNFHVEQPQPPQVVSKLETQGHLGLPEEHKIIKEVFDTIIKRCYAGAENLVTKKKLDDISKRLEVLYCRLHEGNVTPPITAGIHQIVSCLQQSDYNMALAYHTQIVGMGNFSEISSFFPSIKILIHTASQLKVHLH